MTIKEKSEELNRHLDALGLSKEEQSLVLSAVHAVAHTVNKALQILTVSPEKRVQIEQGIAFAYLKSLDIIDELKKSGYSREDLIKEMIQFSSELLH